ncbi:CCCH zinc finger domain-containing protein [Dioscorea alata]|uniref:CCCH zinc finger domain-containing protein n=2 Tax=Dioscorea alata TaxID=55571 RepID=A0ACB7WEF4_DIOAL|nr:CCCH zinc finger domain-containing protein [Dioscorea alata]
MSSSAPRILLCGDVLGRINLLFKRVLSVTKSAGPFDALLIVGQFLPESPDLVSDLSDFIDGRSAVPIPTYFIGDYGCGASQILSVASQHPSNRGFKTDGLQLCANLFWLRGSGRFSLHGLSVVYLSGKSLPDAEGNGRYSRDDVDALRALAEEPGIVDIFMTNEWPSGVVNGADTSAAPPGVMDPSGCDSVVAELVAEIKPRYHIAGTKGVFYDREPYSNIDAAHVTRFIGLAAVGNKEKQKFIHAISPTPASTMSAADICSKPPNTTLSPYVVTEKKSHSREATKRSVNDDIDAQYWRYDVSKKRQRQGQGGVAREKLCFNFTSRGSCARGENCNFRHDDDARVQYQRNVCFDFLNLGKCERGPDCKFNHEFMEEGDTKGKHGSQNTGTSRRSLGKRCWFCLSSSDVESHLILSVGESWYLALAKGPLVDHHVLLVPIEHHPHTLTMSPDAEKELGIFKNAVNMYFKKQGKAVIFFEYLLQNISHANLQAIPIPLSKVSNTQLIFNLASKKLGFEFAIISAQGDRNEGRKLLRSQFEGKSSVFYVELPDGTILWHSVDEKDKFPVQFGREVLAGLLNVADRADWRNCKMSKEDEIKMAETFKMGFEEFDPAR